MLEIEYMSWYICGSHSGDYENCCLIEFDAVYSGRYTVILEEKVTTVQNYSIGHCEKNVHMNMCLPLNCYRGRAVWIYKYKSIVNGKKKEKLLTANFILTLI